MKPHTFIDTGFIQAAITVAEMLNDFGHVWHEEEGKPTQKRFQRMVQAMHDAGADFSGDPKDQSVEDPITQYFQLITRLDQGSGVMFRGHIEEIEFDFDIDSTAVHTLRLYAWGTERFCIELPMPWELVAIAVAWESGYLGNLIDVNLCQEIGVNPYFESIDGEHSDSDFWDGLCEYKPKVA
jgi:hypothetical protein